MAVNYVVGAWGEGGIGNVDIIEKVQLKFSRQIFYLKMQHQHTLSMVNCEPPALCRNTKNKTVSFWCKLIDNYENNQLSSLIKRTPFPN